MPKWDGIRPEARGKRGRVRRTAIGPARMPRGWEAKQRRAVQRAEKAVERAEAHAEAKIKRRTACINRCQASFAKVHVWKARKPRKQKKD